MAVRIDVRQREHLWEVRENGVLLDTLYSNRAAISYAVERIGQLRMHGEEVNLILPEKAHSAS